jgi:hypothetical protein
VHEDGAPEPQLILVDERREYGDIVLGTDRGRDDGRISIGVWKPVS